MAAARTAFTFQLRWEWIGVARLTKLLLTAMPMDIPKFDCLVLAPPDDPIENIIIEGKASGTIPPANQYFNTEQTYTCPAGYSGTPVTIPAGTYESSVSVAAANALALAAAQAAAVCTLIPKIQAVFSGTLLSADFDVQVAVDGSSYAEVVYGQVYTVNASLKSKTTCSGYLASVTDVELSCAITNSTGAILAAGSKINAVNGVSSGSLNTEVTGTFNESPFNFGGPNPGSTSETITGPVASYNSFVQARSTPGPNFAATSVEVIFVLGT
jgi:hypothetical protein